MKKRKRSTSPLVEGNLMPDYKSFLNTHLPKKPPQKLTRAITNGWQDAPNTDQGKIVNEIARKFNTHNTLGIDKVKYDSVGQPNFYEGATLSGNTRMTLAPPPFGTKREGPNPITVGHELVHANDHQIDRLNPSVWEDLRVLATTGGVGNGNMQNFNEFGHSVGKIQDKIDPTGAFKPTADSFGSGYPIDKDYIEKEIRGSTGDNSYTIPTASGSNVPDWPVLFDKIQSVVTSPAIGNEKVPNQGFYLNRASEFPAFMSERLTDNWKTNTAPNPLSLPEARFVHSTLGRMGNAYPNPNYPTKNNYIMARRGSLEAAYPGLNPQQPYSSSQSSSSGSNPIYAGIGVGGQSSSSQLSLPPSTVSSQASSVPSPHTSPSSPSTPVYYSPPSSSNLPPTYKKGGAVHSLAEHIYPFKLRHPKFSVTKGLSRYF